MISKLGRNVNFLVLFSLVCTHSKLKRATLKFTYYRISSYSFRGNYSFLNFEIQRSQYIRPKVTVHKGAETIQGRKLFKGGNYMRKYGISYLGLLFITTEIALYIYWFFDIFFPCHLLGTVFGIVLISFMLIYFFVF